MAPVSVIATRAGAGEPFAVVFAAIGITARETRLFVERFRGSRALERTVLFLNETRDPTIEQLLVPRHALAQAEHPEITMLAQAIATTQRAEIVEMQGYLHGQ